MIPLFKDFDDSLNELRTPEAIRKEYKMLKKLPLNRLRSRWSLNHKVGDPTQLDKEGVISDILRDKYGDKYVDSAFENLNENKDYEYDPQKHQKRLRDKINTNIRRYKDAQSRGDNYAIKYYELRMRLDKIEEEKLKVKKAIHDLKRKFKKS